MKNEIRVLFAESFLLVLQYIRKSRSHENVVSPWLRTNSLFDVCVFA